MKKLLALIVLAAGVFDSNAQRQKAHFSTFAIRFDKLSIVLVNEFMKEPAMRSPLSPTYVQFPLNTNVFRMYGPYTKVLVTTLKEPFKIENKPGGTTVAGRILADTVKKDNEQMRLEDLEIIDVSSRYNGPWRWQSITKYPPTTSTSLTMPLSEGHVKYNKGTIYEPVGLMLQAYDTVNIIIRNKKTQKQLVRFHLIGINRPVVPFLSIWSQDSSSSRSIAAFMKKEMEGQAATVESINSFYKSWPEEYGGVLKNEKLYETSKLALYFRKAGPEFPDSSMEYRMLSESDRDTTWYKTGHLLFVTQLRPDQHYKLQIRYSLFPEYIKEHTFYVVPRWYQTTKYKLLMTGTVVLLLLIALLFAYRRHLKKVKRKREQLALELKSIRSQLNPHFVFNALSSIQGLVNKNDITSANHYLTEFSTLLRESLSNNDKEMVPINTEIRLLETYLRLEQLRFNFRYSISIDKTLDGNTIEVPWLMLQPIVENAVKHGVAGMNEKGMIEIRFWCEEKNLHISINDNGKGFSSTIQGTGFGLKLTKDRIQLLNRSHKKETATFHIAGNGNNGTTVNLILKNWL